MRKSIAIIFLALLLLNILGYYGLFLGLWYQNNITMTQKLDDNIYDEAQAITIKVPITVPYATDSRDFVRVEGLIEHEGEFYRLIKQRLLSDTLHIVCVKDQQSKRINEALTDYVKTFTDKPVSDTQQTVSYSDFIKDYLTTSIALTNLNSGWQRELTSSAWLAVFLPSYAPSIVHPPERA